MQNMALGLQNINCIMAIGANVVNVKEENIMSRFEFRKNKTGLTTLGRKQLDAAKSALKNKTEWVKNAEKRARIANVNANNKTILIPLAEEHEAAAITAFKKKEPRKKNIMTPKPCLKPYQLGSYDMDTIEYKGRFKGWKGSTYTPLCQSAGRISADGSVLGAVVDKQNYVISAPRGYQWRVDSLGIKLVRLSDGAEHHIDSANAISGAAHCRSALIRAAEYRKIAAKSQEAIFSEKKKLLQEFISSKTKIELRDSIAAGNCRAGSMRFAEILGLDTSNSHKIGDVVKLVIKNRGKFAGWQIDRFIRVIQILTAQSAKAA